MPSNRSNRSRSESSPQREGSGQKSSESPELLHQLGRAVLSYSMKRLSGQDTSDSESRSTGRHERGTSRRSRSSAGGKDRDTERGTSRGPGTRSDSGDMHHIMAQVAVGLIGFGIRQYLHHRKQAKQRAATAQPPRRPGRERDLDRSGPENDGTRSRGMAGNRPADPELADALKSLTTELEGTSKSIRNLTSNAPSHKNCEVHDKLKAEEEELQGSIANIQTCVNNMKNLHGGLERNRSVEGPRQRGREEEGPAGSSRGGRARVGERKRGVDSSERGYRPSSRSYNHARDGRRR